MKLKLHCKTHDGKQEDWMDFFEINVEKISNFR